MLTYELAKSLKDAGFPQKNYLGAKWFSDVSHPRMGRYPGDVVYTQVSEADVALGTYRPTLEELIEACGEKFGTLELDWMDDCDTQEWVARQQGHKALTDITKGVGSTPTEAVANLLLHLLRYKMN